MKLYYHILLLCFLNICFVFVSSVVINPEKLKEEFSWTRVSYEVPRQDELTSRSSYGTPQGEGSPNQNSESPSADSIFFDGASNAAPQNQNGNNNGALEIGAGSIDYQYPNNIPMGLNVWKDKLFISVPRRRLGVPSTLNYVSLNSNNRQNVPLRPYPNWNINLYPDATGNGENLISVYRFTIDPCERMWLVDTGILELPGNRTYARPHHQIVVIDLKTDQIIHRYNIPASVLTPVTTLSDLTVDVTSDTCNDAYVYFPDLAGYGLVVYSLKDNRSWRVNHNYFYLESTKGEMSIAGHRFQWNDGVFSTELTKVKSDGFRDMYFHSMAGTHIFKVSTRVLRDELLATRSYHENNFKIVGDRGPNSQATTAALHQPTGIMFMGLINKNAVGCWNTNKDLKSLAIVERDDDKMIYPSDVRIVGDRVYMLTNTMPGFLYGQLNYDEVNFRVWSSDISSAIRGTTCQS